MSVITAVIEEPCTWYPSWVAADFHEMHAAFVYKDKETGLYVQEFVMSRILQQFTETGKYCEKQIIIFNGEILEDTGADKNNNPICPSLSTTQFYTVF